MMMRVLVRYSSGFDDEALAAYCRYHDIDPKRRAEARERIRSTLEQVGQMGIDEQIHEGRQWLAGDAENLDAQR